MTNLELTNAFAAIANEGVYTKPRFFTKIIDHNGKVLVNNQPKTHSVIKESTAFLLTDAMAASLVSSRKFSRGGVSVNSTSTRCRLENMSAAGKSGTTTANNDVWFVGFTPYYSAGIWAGYDKNQKLSSAGGGTSFHKDIWKAIMTRVHEGKEDPGFPVPESVETAVICRKSGKLAIPGVCSNDPRGNATYTEYFAKGTVPTEMCDHHATITVCAESGQLPGAFCTNLTTKVIMIVPKNSGTTDDSHFLTPGACSVHIGPPAETEPGSNELNSEAPPASPTRDYGPHLGPPSSINSPPQLMIPSN